jgi:hypothetical protein
MTRITLSHLGILVEYVDGTITCTADGEPQGVYRMGETMIVGSTILSAAIRRAIHARLTATLESATVGLA